MANVTIVADWSTFGTVGGRVILWPPTGAPTVVPITANAISTTVPANTTGDILLYGIAFADMTIGTQPAKAIPPSAISIPATAQTVDLLSAISPSPIPVARPIGGGGGGGVPSLPTFAASQIVDATTIGRQLLTAANQAAVQTIVGASGGGGGLSLTDDGTGLFTIGSSGSATLTDDGTGLFTIGS